MNGCYGMRLNGTKSGAGSVWSHDNLEAKLVTVRRYQMLRCIPVSVSTTVEEVFFQQCSLTQFQQKLSIG